MGKSVALISLYPLSEIGGGERYTLWTFRSIQAAGDHCVLFARKAVGPERSPLSQRLQTAFTMYSSDAAPLKEVALSEVLMQLALFDVVWVHQYLSCDIVFDLLSVVASTQLLLLTNLGHEPLLPVFQDLYCHAANQVFVEISQYAAQRARLFSPRSIGVTGALWRTAFAGRVTGVPPRPSPQICSVGRVLPHKGIEVTIAALPSGWHCNVVGPFGETAYLKYLKEVARDKSVVFSGPVPEAQKEALLCGSVALVASSCHKLYDGREIPQAELLGLVIFEAIVAGVLPITSDIPSFLEIMQSLGLSGFVYPARDAAELSSRLHSTARLEQSERQELMDHAASVIEREYLWDDYWPRVVAYVERQ